MAKISLRIVDDTDRDTEAASHTPHPRLRAIYAGDQPVGLLGGRLRRR
jgi:hypothetical protein